MVKVLQCVTATESGFYLPQMEYEIPEDSTDNNISYETAKTSNSEINH